MGSRKLRRLLAVAVVAAEIALHLDRWWVGIPVALIVLLAYRSPLAAFVAALALSSLTQLTGAGCFVLLLWAAYHAGREVLSRSGTVIVIGGSVGALAGQLVRAGDPRLIAPFLIFVVLPLLAGRYLAQNERLVDTLRANERLRLARDMHDSLGHRLSLVSVQAAALEVSDLPEPHRSAVKQLAQSARAAMDELYELVGALRGSATAIPGMDRVDDLVRDFSSAGARITLRRNGVPQSLPDTVAHAAYRVVEEGLTNATKHAPGQPVGVEVTWERDALLLTVVNPVETFPQRHGHGLNGLRERVEHAGGLLDHRVTGGEFRLAAMFPATAGVGRGRVIAIGLSVAAVMFVLLPATGVMGVAR
jgi:signal transduction histidine kinase